MLKKERKQNHIKFSKSQKAEKVDENRNKKQGQQNCNKYDEY